MTGLDRLKDSIDPDHPEELWEAVALVLDDHYLISAVRRRYEIILEARYPKTIKDYGGDYHNPSHTRVPNGHEL